MELSQNMSATSALALLFNTKEQNKSLSDNFISAMEQGEINPLKAHAMIKSIEDLLNRFTDSKKYEQSATKYKEMVIDEAAKYAEKSFDAHGCKFTKSEVGVQYKWDNTNDPVLLEIMEQMEPLANKLKERQEYLKKVPSEGVDILHGDELIRIYPPVKTSTSSITVKVL